ncbi:MAG: outer membrane protein assembly factor BamE [Phycisphaerae bacterium]|nr:outer membrane protein assembly factor BamE [Phycisphaerae bacterium]
MGRNEGRSLERAGAWRTATRVAFIGAIVFAAGCAPQQYEEHWSDLRVGMTRDQVEAALGKPSSTFSPPPASRDGVSASTARERWQYGDTLSTLGTRALFPEEADERAWCVFFGADGRVTGFERPLRSR